MGRSLGAVQLSALPIYLPFVPAHPCRSSSDIDDAMPEWPSLVTRSRPQALSVPGVVSAMLRGYILLLRCCFLLLPLCRLKPEPSFCVRLPPTTCPTPCSRATADSAAWPKLSLTSKLVMLRLGPWYKVSTRTSSRTPILSVATTSSIARQAMDQIHVGFGHQVVLESLHCRFALLLIRRLSFDNRRVRLRNQGRCRPWRC